MKESIWADYIARKKENAYTGLLEKLKRRNQQGYLGIG
jgi:hypothetical protein